MAETKTKSKAECTTGSCAAGRERRWTVVVIDRPNRGEDFMTGKEIQDMFGGEAGLRALAPKMIKPAAGKAARS